MTHPVASAAHPLFVPIADGDELVQALGAAVRGRDGWVQAVGAIEAIELRAAGDGSDPRRALKGRWTLVSLAGPAGGPYGVVLARASGLTPEVSGGHLVAARALGVTAYFAPLVGGGAEASIPDAASPAERAPGGAPSIPLGSAPVSGGPRAGRDAPSGWAAAAATALADAVAVGPAEPELPDRGDRIQHAQFGLCDVLTVSGDRLKVRDVHGPGRIREISLGVFAVQRLPDRDGKRVFKLQKR